MARLLLPSLASLGSFAAVAVLTPAPVSALESSGTASGSSSGRNVELRTKVVPELGKLFKAKTVVGTFALLDRETGTLFVSDETRARERFRPASTFKIVNALIGLEVGAVKDMSEVLPYGGKPQRFKRWEQDMNLRDAMQASNVPVFQELARRIGLQRMREHVQKFGYGNMEIGEIVDKFWLDGPLAISAIEQVEFLDRLTENKLPVRAETSRAVDEITLLEQTEAYELHGKTGWHMPGVRKEVQIGWWVGWVKRDGKAYPFALNIDIQSAADAAKRIPLGRECLALLGKL